MFLRAILPKTTGTGSNFFVTFKYLDQDRQLLTNNKILPYDGNLGAADTRLRADRIDSFQKRINCCLTQVPLAADMQLRADVIRQLCYSFFLNKKNQRSSW